MNYSLVQEASDALSLLSLEFARPALIIGTSRGGLLSMIIHGVRADLIAGIVLNDIGPEFEVEGLTKIMGYLGVTPEPTSRIQNGIRGPVEPLKKKTARSRSIMIRS